MNSPSKVGDGSAKSAGPPKQVGQEPQVFRETLESLAVAFILALMFKAFIAEAFIIPTGSMAPTLMGAHKDIVCEDCGFPYQCGASSEYTDVGAQSGVLFFGTICPLCRKPQVLDLVNNANHRTFTGDRILVSKLAYVFSKPQRWQVFVFKYAEDARLNYIKRCLGTSNETIRISHGDVYVSTERPARTFEIARKPPHVIQAMLQPLADTRYPAKSLLEAKVPDAWQPLGDSAGDWKIGYDGTRWLAKVQGVPAASLAMIRYRHRVLDPGQWESLRKRQQLPQPLAADSYRLITDFTAYNAGTSFVTRSGSIPVNYSEIAQSELDKAMRTSQGSSALENDGLHWTGDLSGRWEIETEATAESLRLLVVEAGVEHRCDIDLKTGIATATLVIDGKPLAALEDGKGGRVDAIQAQTSVRAGAKHLLQWANVDDSLTLWVDGIPVVWGNRGRFSVGAAVADFQHAPRTGPNDPLDAAPLGIGVRGGGCRISQASVARDIYYIAHSSGDSMNDYGIASNFLRESSSDAIRTRYSQTLHGMTQDKYISQSSMDAFNRNALFSDIDAWNGAIIDTQRRSVTFELPNNAYFPMGDNSSASQDARSWENHFVPERLMIGRAVLVFWPHFWNAPIPFLPNFQRMGLIR